MIFVLLVLFTTGVTLITSSVNVFYRDVSPVVQISLQLWLYLTPIAYPLAKVPARWRGWIAANPLSGIVEGFRSAVVYGREPDWSLRELSHEDVPSTSEGASPWDPRGKTPREHIVGSKMPVEAKNIAVGIVACNKKTN